MAAESTFTIYDLHGTGTPRSARELPRLVFAALRIVWSAGRRQAATAIALQLVGGLGTAAIVLLGQRLVYGGFGASNLYESALFIRDIVSFLDLAPRRGVLPLRVRHDAARP